MLTPFGFARAVFENREFCLFLEDFDSLFYLLGMFFYNSNLAVWLITHLSVTDEALAPSLSSHQREASPDY